MSETQPPTASMDASNPLPHDHHEEPEPTETEKSTVRVELERLKGFVTGMTFEDLKTGTWFPKLLTYSLLKYASEVDADYFRRKYPNLPADMVVDARIQLATRYAGIEGGLNAAAYSGAIAATIGSGGAASPISVSAGATGFALDLAYTTQLQLRLVYDIAVLYNVPLDLDDPEDLWKLIRLAFAIKTGETAAQGVLKASPAVIRPLIKKFYGGATLAAAKSLPVIGKHLLQRNVIKMALPGINVPLATLLNHHTTKIAGESAKALMRREARIIELAGRLVERSDDIAALMWVLSFVAQADKRSTDSERLLLHHVARVANAAADTAPAIDLRSVIEVDEQKVHDLVADAGDAAPFYKAAVAMAAVDGSVSHREMARLAQIAAWGDVQHRAGDATRLAEDWR